MAFRYDAFNRRIAKLVDADGDEDFDTEQHFVYDEDHIALVFDEAGELTNRILHGPEVDQVLADEDLSQLITDADRVRWPQTDNLNTVRDIVDNNGDVLNHIDYDAFGNRAAETNSAIDHLFGFTGRDWDEETGLQYNRNRYYDPVVGRWISEDPIAFEAGDTNLARYVANQPTNSTDPTGLFDPITGGVAIIIIIGIGLAYPDAAATPANDADIGRANADTAANRDARGTASVAVAVGGPIVRPAAAAVLGVTAAAMRRAAMRIRFRGMTANEVNKTIDGPQHKLLRELFAGKCPTGLTNNSLDAAAEISRRAISNTATSAAQRALHIQRLQQIEQARRTL